MTVRPALLLCALLLGGGLAACGGGANGGEGDAAPGPAVAASGPPDAQEITLVGTPSLDYEPAVVAARPGTLVLTLRTESGPPHDLVFDDPSLPEIGAVGAGEQASQTYTFSSPGTFDFVCTFHPGMDGQVVVS